MADPTAEAELIRVGRLPEHTAAGGACERRAIAEDVLAEDRVGCKRRVLALQS
jgi:hypothetical protein